MTVQDLRDGPLSGSVFTISGSESSEDCDLCAIALE